MAARNIAKKSAPRKAPGARREPKASNAGAAPAATTGTTTVKAAAREAKAPEKKGFARRKEEFTRYLQSVRTEFRRVTWPGRRELKMATMVVLFTLVMFSVYLGSLDWLLVRLFGWADRIR